MPARTRNPPFSFVLAAMLGPLAAGAWHREVLPAAVEPPTMRKAPKGYETREIEGWQVLVNKGFLVGTARPGRSDARAARLPALPDHRAWSRRRPLSKLKTIRIWVEENEPHHPCMTYHPDPKWLREHGMNPEKARCVELANARTFLDWTLEQPWMLLHELSHGYHHQFLEGGFENTRIKAAYDHAMKTSLYDRVLRSSGEEEKAYAATNPMEYFAEASEAYFGTNDFFPFVRIELRRHDPTAFDTLESSGESSRRVETRRPSKPQGSGQGQAVDDRQGCGHRLPREVQSPPPRLVRAVARRAGPATRPTGARTGGTSRAGSAPRCRRARDAGRACWPAGVSSRWPESAGLIWKRTRISNSRRTWCVKCRLRLLTVSHQAIDVDAQAGAFAEDRVEVVGGAGLVLAPREAEVVLAAAEVAEPRQVVDEQEDLGPVAVGLLPALDLRGRPRRGSARCRASRRPRRRAARPRRCAPATSGVRMVFGRAVEDEEAGPRTTWSRSRRRDTGPPGSAGARPITPSAASSFWPTIRRWLPPCRRNRAEVGSLIAIASPSQAWADRGDGGQAGASSRSRSSGFEPRSAGASPSKTIGVRARTGLRSRASSWSCSRYASRRSSESQTTWKKWLPSGAPLASL